MEFKRWKDLSDEEKDKRLKKSVVMLPLRFL